MLKFIRKVNEWNALVDDGFGSEVEIRFQKETRGSNTQLSAWEEYGPFATLTKSPASLGLKENLASDKVIIKNCAENEGILTVLICMGMVTPVSEVSAGYHLCHLSKKWADYLGVSI